MHRVVAMACISTAAVLAVVPGEEAATWAAPYTKAMTATVLAVVPGEEAATWAAPYTKAMTATCGTVARSAGKATALSLDKASESESRR